MLDLLKAFMTPFSFPAKKALPGSRRLAARFEGFRTLDELDRWLDAYGRAWERKDLDGFVGCFAGGAVYAGGRRANRFAVSTRSATAPRRRSPRSRTSASATSVLRSRPTGEASPAGGSRPWRTARPRRTGRSSSSRSTMTAAVPSSASGGTRAPGPPEARYPTSYVQVLVVACPWSGQLPGVVAHDRHRRAARLDAVHLDLGAADHEVRVGAASG